MRCIICGSDCTVNSKGKCIVCEQTIKGDEPVNIDYAQLNAWRRRVERENTTSINPPTQPHYGVSLTSRLNSRLR